jgi:hypothetical protein
MSHAALSGAALAIVAVVSLVAGCGAARQPGTADAKAGAAGSTGAGPGSASVPAAGGTGSTGKPVKHADFLNGVSCAGPSWCVAVGSYYFGADGRRHTLAERWTGTRWAAVQLPAGARDGNLTAISCASATWCIAVGSPILGWNGRTWRVQRGVSPFDAVSCATPDSCVAVGVTGSGHPVAGTWNGRRWLTGPMAAPPHSAQSVTVSGVSCSAPDACMAVGDYSFGASARPSPKYRDLTLAERWNGTRWQVEPTADVARRDRLVAVSCARGGACVAVGSARAKVTLAERWDGSAWHAEKTPSFGAIGYSELTGVSCVTAVRCVAVGDYDLASPAGLRDKNGSWTLARMVAPPGPQAIDGLAVACAATACQAVGSAGGNTFAEHWNGTSWQLKVAANPQ